MKRDGDEPHNSFAVPFTSRWVIGTHAEVLDWCLGRWLASLAPIHQGYIRIDISVLCPNIVFGDRPIYLYAFG